MPWRHARRRGYFLLEQVGRNTFGIASATPIVTKAQTACGCGEANVSRCGEKQRRWSLPSIPCSSDRKNLSIIASGPMIPEAMRAAYILRQEFGYETRVINVHTMKTD